MLRRLQNLLFLCLLTGSLAAQPGDINRTDEQGRKQGPWAKTWDNGRVRYQGQFTNDKPHGEFRHFDEEGVLATVQTYEADGGSSTARHFHPDGSLMAEGRYAGREKDGEWRYFDAQGKLRRVETFTAGVLDGEVITYFWNGQVAEKNPFQKGKLHGTSRSWFESGMQRSEENYVNGVAEGKWILYHPSGKKEMEGSMKAGQRHGTWFHFNSDGSLHMKLGYTGGKLKHEVLENGIFRDQYPDEQPKSEVTYKNGRKEGPFVEYHNNGNWVIRQVPADPVTGAQPDVERELKGQTRKMEGTYKNDQLHGEVKEYSEKGRLVKVTKYDTGVVVAEEVKK